MAMTDLKVSEATLNKQGVVAAPDRLTGTAQENKALFDRLVRSIVAGALNPLIDLLASGAGAAGLGAVFAGLASPTVQAALDELARRVERKADAAAMTAALDALERAVGAKADATETGAALDALERAVNAKADAADTAASLEALGGRVSGAEDAAHLAAARSEEASRQAGEVRGLAQEAVETARDAAAKAGAVYYLLDPSTGERLPIQEVVDHIYNLARVSPITAGEYAALALTADAYAAFGITASEYSMKAKQLLIGA